jgi:hypothetical protein
VRARDHRAPHRGSQPGRRRPVHPARVRPFSQLKGSDGDQYITAIRRDGWWRIKPITTAWPRREPHPASYAAAQVGQRARMRRQRTAAPPRKQDAPSHGAFCLRCERTAIRPHGDIVSVSRSASVTQITRSGAVRKCRGKITDRDGTSRRPARQPRRGRLLRRRHPARHRRTRAQTRPPQRASRRLAEAAAAAASRRRAGPAAGGDHKPDLVVRILARLRLDPAAHRPRARHSRAPAGHNGSSRPVRARPAVAAQVEVGHPAHPLPIFRPR